MKNTITLSLLILSFSLSSNSQANINNFANELALSENLSYETKVFVCGGEYAEKFHSRNNCSGLNNCKGGIYYINSQQEAINNGYKYCRICWR